MEFKQVVILSEPAELVAAVFAATTYSGGESKDLHFHVRFANSTLDERRYMSTQRSPAGTIRVAALASPIELGSPRPALKKKHFGLSETTHTENPLNPGARTKQTLSHRVSTVKGPV